MKHKHEDFESLMNALRNCKARFICFQHGPIIDKDAYFQKKESEEQKTNNTN